MNRPFFPDRIRGLLYKEWRQQRFAFFGFMIAAFFQPVIGSLVGELVTLYSNSGHLYPGNNLGNWAHAVLMFQGSNSLSLFPFGVAILWGAYMVGVERRSNNVETLLTGPVRRVDVVRVKWWLGTLAILLLNLPGPLLLLAEAHGWGSQAFGGLDWTLKWYLVHAGIEWLAFSAAFAASVGLGTMPLAWIYAFVGMLLPAIVLSAYSTMVASVPHYFAEYGPNKTVTIGSSIGDRLFNVSGGLFTLAQQDFNILYYLGDNYTLGLHPLLLDWVFPLCLMLAIGLYFLAMRSFSRMPVESFRRVFAMPRFAAPVWVAAFVVPGYILGLFGASIHANLVVQGLSTHHPWHGPSGWVYFFLWAFGAMAIEAMLFLLLRAGARRLVLRFRPA
ncbi:MAG: hypothetical protein ACYCVB_11465 [Bacilli bacterium]